MHTCVKVAHGSYLARKPFFDIEKLTLPGNFPCDGKASRHEGPFCLKEIVIGCNNKHPCHCSPRHTWKATVSKYEEHSRKYCEQVSSAPNLGSHRLLR